MNADYTDDIVLQVNTPTQDEYLLLSQEQAAGGIGLHVNADKNRVYVFLSKRHISTLNGGSPKLINKFTYLGSSVSSTENDINVRLVQAWTAIDWLLIIWKSILSDK